MDIRIKKTKRTITNTFIELRSKKPLQKITVKELCENANINKSTFYCHFKDIYDLSDTIETEIVSSIVANISHPELVFTCPEQFIKEVFLACLSQESLIKTVFSDDRSSHLISRLKDGLKELIFTVKPEYKNNTMANIVLSYEIYGGYYVFTEYRNYGEEKVIDIVGNITSYATSHFINQIDLSKRELSSE